MALPEVYDNRLWTPLTDEQLVEKFDAERLRLENDERIGLHAAAREPDTWLDYGSGAGLFAGAAKHGDLTGKLEVHAYDPSPVMRKATARWIEEERVHADVRSIPNDYFDVVMCNLVVCIVGDEEVQHILTNIRQKMKEDGVSFITICNPHLFDVPRTRLDLRFPGEQNRYDQPFDLPKWKLEGDYGVTEKHRPEEWYEEQIAQSRLLLKNTILTPPYEFDGKTIQDYLSFKCRRMS